MPTARARHVVTETDEVAEALDAAAKRWPEDSNSRSKLVVRLLREGYRALAEEGRQAKADRLEAVRRTSGLLTGVYATTYLEDLRRDWPA